MSEQSQEYRDKINQHIRDFANVVNDAARNRADVKVLPEEAEAICVLAVEQTMYYVRLVTAKMVNVNPNLNAHSKYGLIVSKLEQAALVKKEVVLTYDEIEEYSKVANELTAYDLFVQYITSRDKSS